jgi:hypothetical protein
MRSPKEMQILIEKLKAEVAALKAQLIEHGITPKIGPLKPIKAAEPSVDLTPSI